MNGGESIKVSARGEHFDGFTMATLPGHSNSSDISSRIYQDIMNVKSAHRPRSNRPSSTKSTSTQLSFPATPRHSARSKMSVSSKQGGFSDVDIIKNRSWSASRVRTSHLGKSGAQRVDAPGQGSSRLSPSLTESQSVLSAVSAPGTAGAQGDKGKQLNSKELWNLRGSQVERLQQEWAAIEHCRAMKRASEIVQHRLNPMYRISGSNIPLLNRYHVNDTEIQRLQEMSETSRILQLDLKRIARHCHRNLQHDVPPCPASSHHEASSFTETPFWWRTPPSTCEDVLDTDYAGMGAALSSLDSSSTSTEWTEMNRRYDLDLCSISSEGERLEDQAEEMAGRSGVSQERQLEADPWREVDTEMEERPGLQEERGTNPGHGVKDLKSSEKGRQRHTGSAAHISTREQEDAVRQSCADEQHGPGCFGWMTYYQRKPQGTGGRMGEPSKNGDCSQHRKTVHHIPYADTSDNEDTTFHVAVRVPPLPEKERKKQNQKKEEEESERLSDGPTMAVKVHQGSKIKKLQKDIRMSPSQSGAASSTPTTEPNSPDSSSIALEQRHQLKSPSQAEQQLKEWPQSPGPQSVPWTEQQQLSQSLAAQQNVSEKPMTEQQQTARQIPPQQENTEQHAAPQTSVQPVTRAVKKTQELTALQKNAEQLTTLRKKTQQLQAPQKKTTERGKSQSHPCDKKNPQEQTTKQEKTPKRKKMKQERTPQRKSRQKNHQVQDEQLASLHNIMTQIAVQKEQLRQTDQNTQQTFQWSAQQQAAQQEPGTHGTTLQGTTPQESVQQEPRTHGTTLQGKTPQESAQQEPRTHGTTLQGKTPQESAQQEPRTHGTTLQGKTPQESAQQEPRTHGTSLQGKTPQESVQQEPRTHRTTLQGKTPQESVQQEPRTHQTTLQGKTPQESVQQEPRTHRTTLQGKTPQESARQEPRTHRTTLQGKTPQESVQQEPRTHGTTLQGKTPQESVQQEPRTHRTTLQGKTPQESVQQEPRTHQTTLQGKMPQESAQREPRTHQTTLQGKMPQESAQREPRTHQTTLQGKTPQESAQQKKKVYEENRQWQLRQQGRGQPLTDGHDMVNTPTLLDLSTWPGLGQGVPKTDSGGGGHHLTAYDRWQKTKRLKTGDTRRTPTKALAPGRHKGTVHGSRAELPDNSHDFVFPGSPCRTGGDSFKEQRLAADCPRKKGDMGVKEDGIKQGLDVDHFRKESDNKGQWVREEGAEKTGNKLRRHFLNQTPEMMEELSEEEEAEGREDGEESGHSEEDYIFSILTSEKFLTDQDKDKCCHCKLPRHLTFKKKGVLWHDKSRDSAGMDQWLKQKLKATFDNSYERFERQKAASMRYLAGNHFHTAPTDRQTGDVTAPSERDCGTSIPVLRTFQLEKSPSSINQQSKPCVKKASLKKRAESQKAEQVNSETSTDFGAADGSEFSTSNDGAIRLADGKVNAGSKTRQETDVQCKRGQEPGAHRSRKGTGDLRPTVSRSKIGPRAPGKIIHAQTNSGVLEQPKRLDQRGQDGVSSDGHECDSSLAPTAEKCALLEGQSRKRFSIQPTPFMSASVAGSVESAASYDTTAEVTPSHPDNRAAVEEEWETIMYHFTHNMLQKKKSKSVGLARGSTVHLHPPSSGGSIPSGRTMLSVMMHGQMVPLLFRRSSSAHCLCHDAFSAHCDAPLTDGQVSEQQEDGWDEDLEQCRLHGFQGEVRPVTSPTSASGDVKSVSGCEQQCLGHDQHAEFFTDLLSRTSCGEQQTVHPQHDSAAGAPSDPCEPERTWTEGSSVAKEVSGSYQNSQDGSVRHGPQTRGPTASPHDRCSSAVTTSRWISTTTNRCYSAEPELSRKAVSKCCQEEKEQAGKSSQDQGHLRFCTDHRKIWRATRQNFSVSQPSAHVSRVCMDIRDCLGQVPFPSQASAYEKQSTLSSGLDPQCSPCGSTSNSASSGRSQNHAGEKSDMLSEQQLVASDPQTFSMTQRASCVETVAPNVDEIRTVTLAQTVDPKESDDDGVQPDAEVCAGEEKSDRDERRGCLEVAGMRMVKTRTWKQKWGALVLTSLHKPDTGRLPDPADSSKQTKSAGKTGQQQPPAASGSVGGGDRKETMPRPERKVALKQPGSESLKRVLMPLHIIKPQTSTLALDSDRIYMAANDNMCDSCVIRKYAEEIVSIKMGTEEGVLGSKGSASHRMSTGKVENSGKTDTSVIEKNRGMEHVANKCQTTHYQAITATEGSVENCEINKQVGESQANDSTQGGHFSDRTPECRAGPDSRTASTPLVVNYMRDWHQSCSWNLQEDGAHDACRQSSQGSAQHSWSVSSMQQEQTAPVPESGSRLPVEELVQTVVQSPPAVSAVDRHGVPIVGSLEPDRPEDRHGPCEASVEEHSPQSSAHSVQSSPWKVQGNRFTVPSNTVWGFRPPALLWDRLTGQMEAWAQASHAETAAEPFSPQNCCPEENPPPFQSAAGCHSHQSVPGETAAPNSGDLTDSLHSAVPENTTDESSTLFIISQQAAGRTSRTALTLDRSSLTPQQKSSQPSHHTASENQPTVTGPERSKTAGNDFRAATADYVEDMKHHSEGSQPKLQMVTPWEIEGIPEGLQGNGHPHSEGIEVTGQRVLSVSLRREPGLTPKPFLFRVRSVRTASRMKSDTALQQKSTGLSQGKVRTACQESCSPGNVCFFSISKSLPVKPTAEKTPVSDTPPQASKQTIHPQKPEPNTPALAASKRRVPAVSDGSEVGHVQAQKQASAARRCGSAVTGGAVRQRPASTRRVRSACLKTPTGRMGRQSRQRRSKKNRKQENLVGEQNLPDPDKEAAMQSPAASGGDNSPAEKPQAQSGLTPQGASKTSSAHTSDKSPGPKSGTKRGKKSAASGSSGGDPGAHNHSATRNKEKKISFSLSKTEKWDSTIDNKEKKTVDIQLKTDTDSCDVEKKSSEEKSTERKAKKLGKAPVSTKHEFKGQQKKRQTESKDHSSTLKNENKRQAESDDHISTLKNENKRQTESKDHISLLKNENKRQTESKDHISLLKNENKRQTEIKDHISLLKNENKRQTESKDHISLLKNENKRQTESKDHISLLKNENKRQTESKDHISELKNENQRQTESKDHISLLKNREKRQTESKKHISKLKNENKGETESKDHISTLKNEKKRQTESKDHISTLKNEKKRETESKDHISLLKNENKRQTESKDHISTLKNEKKRETECKDHISLLKNKNKRQTESKDHISTLKNEKKRETECKDHISLLKNKNKRQTECKDHISLLKNENQRQTESKNHISKLKNENKGETESKDIISTLKNEKKRQTESKDHISTLKNEKKRQTESKDHISLLKNENKRETECKDHISKLKNRKKRQTGCKDHISMLRSEAHQTPISPKDPHDSKKKRSVPPRSSGENQKLSTPRCHIMPLAGWSANSPRWHPERAQSQKPKKRKVKKGRHRKKIVLSPPDPSPRVSQTVDQSEEEAAMYRGYRCPSTLSMESIHSHHGELLQMSQVKEQPQSAVRGWPFLDLLENCGNITKGWTPKGLTVRQAPDGTEHPQGQGASIGRRPQTRSRAGRQECRLLPLGLTKPPQKYSDHQFKQSRRGPFHPPGQRENTSYSLSLLLEKHAVDSPDIFPQSGEVHGLGGPAQKCEVDRAQGRLQTPPPSPVLARPTLAGRIVRMACAHHSERKAPAGKEEPKGKPISAGECRLCEPLINRWGMVVGASVMKDVQGHAPWDRGTHGVCGQVIHAGQRPPGDRRAGIMRTLSETGWTVNDTGRTGSNTGRTVSDTGRTGSDTRIVGDTRRTMNDTGRTGSDTRIVGDTRRTMNDTGRTGSETGRIVSDTRIVGETRPVNNTGGTGIDTGRTVSDTGRTVSDTGRTVSDTGRTVSDTRRTVSDTRVSNTKRTMNNTGRTMNDSRRTMNDTGRTMNNTARTMNDTGRTMNDTERTMNDTRRTMSDMVETMSGSERTVNNTGRVRHVTWRIRKSIRRTRSDTGKTMGVRGRAVKSTRRTRSDTGKTMGVQGRAVKITRKTRNATKRTRNAAGKTRNARRRPMDVTGKTMNDLGRTVLDTRRALAATGGVVCGTPNAMGSTLSSRQRTLHEAEGTAEKDARTSHSGPQTQTLAVVNHEPDDCDSINVVIRQCHTDSDKGSPPAHRLRQMVGERNRTVTGVHSFQSLVRDALDRNSAVRSVHWSPNADYLNYMTRDGVGAEQGQTVRTQSYEVPDVRDVDWGLTDTGMLQEGGDDGPVKDLTSVSDDSSADDAFPAAARPVKMDHNVDDLVPKVRLMDPALEMLEDMDGLFDTVIEGNPQEGDTARSWSLSPRCKPACGACRFCHSPQDLAHGQGDTASRSWHPCHSGTERRDKPEADTVSDLGLASPYTRAQRADRLFSETHVFDLFPETCQPARKKEFIPDRKECSSADYHYSDRELEWMFPELKSRASSRSNRTCSHAQGDFPVHQQEELTAREKHHTRPDSLSNPVSAGSLANRSWTSSGHAGSGSALSRSMGSLNPRQLLPSDPAHRTQQATPPLARYKQYVHSTSSGHTGHSQSRLACERAQDRVTDGDRPCESWKPGQSWDTTMHPGERRGSMTRQRLFPKTQTILCLPITKEMPMTVAEDPKRMLVNHGSSAWYDPGRPACYMLPAVGRQKKDWLADPRQATRTMRLKCRRPQSAPERVTSFPEFAVVGQPMVNPRKSGADRNGIWYFS